MNKKISRILGVGLSAVLLVSLAIGMAVVPAAGASTAWSAQTIPSALGTVIANVPITHLVVSPDGSTIFAVDGGATPTVYRSTNGGVTFTAATTAPGAAVTAIAVSPSFAVDSTVYAAATIAGNGRLYASTDGGATFVQVAADIAGEVITSISLSPNFAVDGLGVVGTTDPVGAAYGDVYAMGFPLTFGLTSMGLTADVAATLGGVDVSAVAFSPNYPSDRTILAVAASAAATPGVRLHSSVNWQPAPALHTWDATYGAAVVLEATTTEVGVAGATDIVSAAIALPTDYNGMNLAARLSYVGVISGVAAATDVHRVTNLTPALLGTAIAPASVSYSGTVAAGSLFVGDNAAASVLRATNPGTGAVTFLAATQAPTGANGTQVVAVGTMVYAGTQGAESAFSVSDNGGANFYQTALINTTLNTITDVTPSPAYDTDMTIFMVTEDGGAGPESLWKTIDGGTTWRRVLAFVTTSNNAIVRLSPAYATDGVVLFAEQGTAVGNVDIRKSLDAGASWLPMGSIVLIADLVVEDATTFYVADASVAGGNMAVQKNINGAWHWGAGTVALVNPNRFFSLNQAANGDILVGDLAGGVYRSTDAGMTYAKVGAGIGATAAGVVTAFDANYATNGIVYAGDSSSNVAGLFRIDASTATAATAWTLIDCDAVTALTQPAGISGIVVSPDGTLYAADPAAAAATAGGIVRSLNPTAGTATAPTAVWEWVNVGDGLTAGYTLASLKQAPGSVVLLAVENSGGAGANRVMTFTDVLTGVVTQTSPANGAKLTTTTTATLAWTAVTGATTYTVTCSGGAVAVNNVTMTAAVTGLTPGATYTWTVRVATPQLGRASASRTFITSLTPTGQIVQPIIPANGAINVTVTPTFTWPLIAGATNYEFVIGEDATFAIIDYSANSPTNIFVTKENLAYSTTYYWRVRGTSATTTSAWTVYSFTTVAKPAEPEPPVVIEEPPELPDIIVEPEVIVEIPAPVEAIPAYLLWVIIGIGGVLVIALIVLIVRTRRVV
jgi:hypothetical protein